MVSIPSNPHQPSLAANWLSPEDPEQPSVENRYQPFLSRPLEGTDDFFWSDKLLKSESEFWMFWCGFCMFVGFSHFG